MAGLGGIGTALARARLRWAFARTSKVLHVTGPITGRKGNPAHSGGIRQIRVHDARHTAVALLLAQGVVVMEIVSHSQISMTSRYAHVLRR